MTVVAFAGAVLGLGAADVQASHARTGTIRWEASDTAHPNVITFHIVTSWRRSYPWPGGPPSVGDTVPLESTTLSFGDGTSVPTLTARVLTVNAAADWFSAEVTEAHAYPLLDGSYTAELSACCRLDTLEGGNADQPLTLRSQVVVDLPSPRRSPAATLLPVVYAKQSQPLTFTLPAMGDGVTFDFAATGAPSGLVVNPPPGLTMTPAGVVTWTPTTIGLYAAQVIATDSVGGSIPIDFMLSVGPVSATVPVLTVPAHEYANVGLELAVDLSAQSAPGTTVQILPGLLPSGLSLVPLTIDPGSSLYALTWTPTLGATSQTWCFQALDSAGQWSLGLTCMTIDILHPLVLSGVIRDFHRNHPDFNRPDGDVGAAFVASALGADHKPVFQPGSPLTTVQGAASFSQWWNDVPGQNLGGVYKLPFVHSTSTDPGVFTFDGNPFYPIDGLFFGNEGDSDNNFFTYELHTALEYTPGLVLEFASADDLWVFLNGRLALSLSGVHERQAASLVLDAVAVGLGLSPGNDYPLDIFYAHRGQHAPGLKIELNRPQWCIPEGSWPLTPADPGALMLLGGARLNADASVRLVPATAPSSAGAAWWRPITWERGFRTQFNFNQRVVNQGDRLEGLAFVLARAPGVGGAGAGLGYSGLGPSVAVEIDTLPESEVLDPLYAHVSVHSRGNDTNSAEELFSLGISSRELSLPAAGGLSGSAIIDLERVPGQSIAWLRVYLEVPGGFPPDTPVLEIQLTDRQLLDALASGDALIGLTASNGTTAGDTDVSNWMVSEFPISSVQTSALTLPVPIAVAQTGSFVVQARDSQGSDLTTGGAAACFDASLGLGPAHQLLASVTDNDGGSYSISYRPDAPGIWSIAARLEGMDIAGSPYPLSVGGCAVLSPVFTSAVALPDPVQIPGSGSVVVRARDLYGAPVTVGGNADCFTAVLVLGGNVVTGSVTDNGDGTYMISFTPTQAGAWTLFVRLSGADIVGSPFSVSVSPDPCALSPALTSAVAPPAPLQIPGTGSFTLQARDQSGTPATTGGAAGCLEAFLILGGNRVSGSVTDNLNGTYTISYSPGIAGDWSLFVRLNGVDIGGSPYPLTVRNADTTPPSVTINQAAGQPDPTNASAIAFTVVFSEPVTGFTASGVSLAGSTVEGLPVVTVSGGPTSYMVLVSGMARSGAVVASVPAGVASDGAGNASLASTSADNVVTFDAMPPFVSPAVTDAPAGGGDGDGVLELAEKLTFAYGVSDQGTGIAIATGCIDDSNPADGCGAGSSVADGDVRSDLAVGPHTLCVYAVDTVGNSTTACLSFSVLYDFTGFLPPVVRPPAVNQVKTPRIVPIAWRITDASGVGVSDPGSFVSLKSALVRCSDWPGNPPGGLPVIGSRPLYLGDGYWAVLWLAPRAYASTCQVLTLTLADEAGVVTERTARFAFK